MPIGAHVSIAGGIDRAPARGQAIGCETIQVFTRGNVRWSFPPLDPGEADAFRKEMKRTGLRPAIGHGCYLINLASADRAIRCKSFDTLVDELRRCAMLGIREHVIHPGSHPGGPVIAIPLIADALNRAFAATPDLDVRVLLETTAGMGHSVGRTFAELRRIIDLVRDRSRIGVCVDTCHIFAAGYDIRTEAACSATIDELLAAVGRRAVRAFHLNDCKTDLGSRVDRHQHIGRGRIGTEAFRLLLADERFAGLPMIIETPKTGGGRSDWDAVNIALLKELRRDGG